METMNELILKLTSLADLAGEKLVIQSHQAALNTYSSRYTITIGSSVYYADFINTSSLMDALMHHTLNLSEKIKNGQQEEKEA